MVSQPLCPGASQYKYGLNVDLCSVLNLKMSIMHSSFSFFEDFPFKPKLNADRLQKCRSGYSLVFRSPFSFVVDLFAFDPRPSYPKNCSFQGRQRRGRDGPLPGHEHPQRVRGGDVAGKDGVLADQMEGIEGEQERGIASRSKNCVMCVIDANWFKRQANVFLHYNVCKCMCLT